MYHSLRALVYTLRALAHVLLTAAGLRAPAEPTARCAACPAPVVLADPHVVLARQVETRSRAGVSTVLGAEAAAVLHQGCADRHEIQLRALTPAPIPGLLAAQPFVPQRTRTGARRG